MAEKSEPIWANMSRYELIHFMMKAYATFSHAAAIDSDLAVFIHEDSLYRGWVGRVSDLLFPGGRPVEIPDATALLQVAKYTGAPAAMIVAGKKWLAGYQGPHPKVWIDTTYPQDIIPENVGAVDLFEVLYAALKNYIDVANDGKPIILDFRDRHAIVLEVLCGDLYDSNIRTGPLATPAGT